MALAFLLTASGCGGDPLAYVLSGLTDQVNEVIAEAESAGNTLQLQAASTVMMAIHQMRVSYDYEMNRTVDKLDDTAQKHLDSLKSSVNDLTAGSQAALNQAMRHSQLLVNALPASNKQPQLTSYSPHFESIAEGTAEDALVKLTGNFLFADRADFTPGLAVAGQSFAPVGITTQELIFRVPLSLFSPVGDGDIGLTVLTASIPWESGVLHKKKQTATYKLLVGTLPLTPGSIELETNTTQQVQEVRQYDTNPSWEHGTGDKPRRTYDGQAPAWLDPVPGATEWMVVPQSCAFVKEADKGGHENRWDYWFVSDWPTVKYDVQTWSGYTDGWIKFHFTYRIARWVPKTIESKVTVDNLTWGSKQVFTVDPNSWKVTLRAFDAPDSPVQIAEPDNTLPFLKVSMDGDKLIIAARPVETIDYLPPSVGN